MAIKSIKASGGDYSTIAQWIASIPSTLTEDYIGELYSEDYNENVLFNGTFTPAGHIAILRAASGSHCGEVPASGSGSNARIVGQTGNETLEFTSANFSILIQGIEFICNSDARPCIKLSPSGGGTAGAALRISECIFNGNGNAAPQNQGFDPASIINLNVTIDNCLFIDFGANGLLVDNIPNSGLIYNCTILNNGTGGLNLTAASGWTIRNVYAGGSGGNDFTGVLGSNDIDYVVTEDATVFANDGASHAYGSEAVSDYFNADGSIKTYSGSGADRLTDVGVDLGSTYINDISGVERTGSWSIGSRERSNNDPPSISISSPDAGTYQTGTSITFIATASDTEDGNLTSSISWSSDIDGALGTGGTIITSSLSNGNHTITASVTDSGSIESTDTISLTISSVIANAGSDQEVPAMKPTVQLDASASISVDGTKTYTWTQTVGTAVVLSDANAVNPTFVAPAVSSDTVLTFQVEVEDSSSNTDTDTVDITVKWGKQGLIYGIAKAMDNYNQNGGIWAKRTAIPYSGISAGVLTGFSSQREDTGTPGWGAEGENFQTDGPTITCTGGEGTGSMLWSLTHVYKQTQNKQYLRYAKTVGDSLLQIQSENASGWYYDCAINENEIQNLGVYGGTRHFLSGPTGIQDILSNDDGISQSCAEGLRYLGEVLEDTNDSDWTKYLEGSLIYYEAMSSPVEFEVSSGVTPYSNGGIPQVWPFERAIAVDYDENSEITCPETFTYNSTTYYGYMQKKTCNDNVMRDYILFLINMYTWLGDLTGSQVIHGDSITNWRSSILTNLQLHVDWIIAVYAQNNGWSQQNALGIETHDVGGAIGLDEPSFGRGKEPPALTCGEHGLAEALAAYYTKTNLGDTARREAIWKTGTPPTGVLQEYADDLEAWPTNNGDHWRYIAGPADPNGEIEGTVTYACEFAQSYGDTNYCYGSSCGSAGTDKDGNPCASINAKSGQLYLDNFDYGTSFRQTVVDGDGYVQENKLANIVNMRNILHLNKSSTATAFTTGQRTDGGWVTGVYVKTKVNASYLIDLADGLSDNSIPDDIVDSDGDGYNDLVEISSGSDEYDIASTPYYSGQSTLVKIVQTTSNSSKQKIKREYVSIILPGNPTISHFQISEAHQSWDKPLINVNSNTNLLTNGNLVSLSSKQLQIILRFNTDYKLRFRTKTNGTWSDWTETSFRTRDKDYKFSRSGIYLSQHGNTVYNNSNELRTQAGKVTVIGEPSYRVENGRIIIDNL